MNGNHLGKDWVYVDKAKVHVSAAKTGTSEHLNATKAPNDPTAKTNFAYLTTDGSNTAPYLKAAP